MRTKGGIVIPDTMKEKMQVADQRAVVVAIGSEAWRDELERRAQPGDKVMLARWSGTMMIGPADGKQYRMVNADDIFARITEESQGPAWEHRANL